jgi:hypothetical protein
MRNIARGARSDYFLENLYKTLGRERKVRQELNEQENTASTRSALYAVEGVIKEIDFLVDAYGYSGEEPAADGTKGEIWR